MPEWLSKPLVVIALNVSISAVVVSVSWAYAVGGTLRDIDANTAKNAEQDAALVELRKIATSMAVIANQVKRNEGELDYRRDAVEKINPMEQTLRDLQLRVDRLD